MGSSPRRGELVFGRGFRFSAALLVSACASTPSSTLDSTSVPSDGGGSDDASSAAAPAPASCSPGTYVTSASGCAACPSGHFSESSNASRCMPWTDCAPGSFVKPKRMLARRCVSGRSKTAPSRYATCGRGLRNLRSFNPLARHRNYRPHVRHCKPPRRETWVQWDRERPCGTGRKRSPLPRRRIHELRALRYGRRRTLQRVNQCGGYPLSEGERSTNQRGCVGWLGRILHWWSVQFGERPVPQQPRAYPSQTEASIPTGHRAPVARFM